MTQVLADLLRVLTFQAGYNTSVVVAGAAALGLAAGLVGVFAMLRRRALVADAVAHAALPGLAAAFLLGAAVGVNPRDVTLLTLGAAFSGVLALVAIAVLSRVRKVGPDAATAVILAGSFGLGVALLSVVQTLSVGRQAGLETYLYGSAAAMTPQEAIFMAGLAVVVAVILGATLRPLLAIAFDEAFASAVGLSVPRYDALVSGLAALVVILALPVAGLVLSVALLAIPPAAARFWSDRAGNMLAISGAIGAAAAALGAAFSAVTPNLPTGPAIVAVAAAIFAVSLLLAPRRGLLARFAA